MAKTKSNSASRKKRKTTPSENDSTGHAGILKNAEVGLKDGKLVAILWRCDVRVPLRKCDYDTPILARLYPFQDDSPEDVLDHPLAGGIVLVLPFWRRFRQWPVCEVANGVTGYRAISAAYAEMRRFLVECGYSEKDFEKADLPSISELLLEGDSRRQAAELKESRERLLKAIGRTVKHFADQRIRRYWLEQMDTIVPSLDTRPFPDLRDDVKWPADRPMFYLVMAVCTQSQTGLSIIPESVRRTEWYKCCGGGVTTDLEISDQACMLISYIERDLREQGLLLDSHGLDEGHNLSRRSEMRTCEGQDERRSKGRDAQGDSCGQNETPTRVTDTFVETSVPDGESWSRIMPLRDIADRIYKNPKKWRSVKSHYGKRLRQIGGTGSRKWQICLDGLPENIVKELNRP